VGSPRASGAPDDAGDAFARRVGLAARERGAGHPVDEAFSVIRARRTRAGRRPCSG